jgi:site-specific recombinase XerD
MPEKTESVRIDVGEHQFYADMSIQPFIPARVKYRESKGLCQWFVEYSVHHPSTGVRHRFRKTNQANRITDRKKKIAYLQEIADAINRKLESGWTPFGLQDLSTVSPKFTTIEAALLQIIDFKSTYREHTGFRDCKSRLLMFITWCKGQGLHLIRAEEVRKEHVFKFLDYLIKVRKNGPKTYNNYVIELRSAFKILLSREIIDKNPFEGIGKLPARSKTHRAYSDNQMAMLLDWIRNNNAPLYRYCIMVMHAIRPLEATKIRVSDVNRQTQTISIWSENAKSGARRSVRIMDRYWPDLVELLEQEAPQHYFLFTTKGVPGEKPTTRDTWSKLFTKERKRCGLSGRQYTMYGLKHTVASKLASSGATMGELMQFTGIKNLNALQAYLSKHIETPVRDFSGTVTY